MFNVRSSSSREVISTCDAAGRSIDHRVDLLGFHKIAAGKPVGFPKEKSSTRMATSGRMVRVQAPDLGGLPRLLLNLCGHLGPIAIDIEKQGDNDGQPHNHEDQLISTASAIFFPLDMEPFSWGVWQMISDGYPRPLRARPAPKSAIGILHRFLLPCSLRGYIGARLLRRAGGWAGGGGVNAGELGGVVIKERFPRWSRLHGLGEIVGPASHPDPAEKPSRRRGVATFGIQADLGPLQWSIDSG